MSISRREAVARLGGLGALSVAPGLGAAALSQATSAKHDFAIPAGHSINRCANPSLAKSRGGISKSG